MSIRDKTHALRKKRVLIQNGTIDFDTATFQPLGSVIQLVLNRKKDSDKTFLVELVAFSYSTDNKYSTYNIQELNQLLANQILTNCQNINKFFNLIENLPNEYENANLRPTNSKSFHAIRDCLTVKAEYYSLPNDLIKFKEVIFKEIGKNAMMLKKYSSYLVKEEVDSCIEKLKDNQRIVKNDSLFIDKLFAMHQKKLTEIDFNTEKKV